MHCSCSIVFQQLYVASGDVDTSSQDDSGSTLESATLCANDTSDSADSRSPGEPLNESPQNENQDSGQHDTDQSQERGSCIVCQCDKVTVVLLPCRHTCVCGDCLVKLDKCPMCRSYIQSYFTLDGCGPGSSYRPQPGDPDDNPANSPQWWVNFNRRVNNFLGFS